jgi:WD40 repeat protein
MRTGLKACFFIALVAIGVPPGLQPGAAQGRNAAQPSPGTRPQLVVQTGSTDEIVGMTFSPDSQYVATVDGGGAIILWDIVGRQLRVFQEDYPVNDIAMSADNRLVAVIGQGDGAKDSGLTLHDVATGKATHYNFPNQSIDTLALSPKGDLALLRTVSEEFGPEGLIVWNVTRRAVVRRFDNGIAGAFSPDGRTLIISFWAFNDNDKGTISYSLQSWDVTTWTRNWETSSTKQRLGVRDKFAFSPDGKQLLATTHTGNQSFDLFDAATGAFINRNFNPDIESGAEYAVSPSQNYYLFYDGKRAGTGGFYDSTVFIYDFKDREIRRLKRSSHILTTVAATNAERNWLLVGDLNGDAYLWDLSEGKEIRRFNSEGSSEQIAEDEEVEDYTGQGSDSIAEISADGRYVVTEPAGGAGPSIYIWDGVNGNLIKETEGGATAVGLSADGGRAVVDRCWGLSLIRLADAGEMWTRETEGVVCNGLADLRSLRNTADLSADGNFILSRASNRGWAALWNASKGRVIKSFPITNGSPLALSPDGRYAAVSYTVFRKKQNPEKFFALLDTFSQRVIKRLRSTVTKLSFAADSKSLLALGEMGLVVIETATGLVSRRIALADDVSVNDICFSPDGRFILIADAEGSVRFYDPEAKADTEREVCQIFSFSDGSWVVVAPDGRFDTNNLENLKGLIWVMPDAPLKALPLEIFMRDYYEPRLLTRLLAGEPLPRLPDLSQLNRVQPAVNITGVTEPDANSMVKVTVEVGNAEGKYQLDGKQVTLTTGVYDLRLFRDGQMVGYTLKDDDQGQPPERPTSKDEELRQWREAAEIKGLDPVTGKRVLTFDVLLPRGRDASQIEFTAYAFNQDRVKSETSRWRWPDEVKARLPKAQEVKRRAYVITIGVNTSMLGRARLQYAANDARLTQRILGESLKKHYEVIPVQLIADDELLDGRTVEIRDATKAKIKAVLGLLAGVGDDGQLRLDTPKPRPIAKATPDDLILIYFSGHGYADASGNFYLLPYDVRNSPDPEQKLPDLTSCVSSKELSEWLRGVDGGEMVMIIDACHAAAFTGSGFKPGPMGSRGLGQLSYDKGMRILAATQAEAAALEVGGQIQQGLLSYTLLKEGLAQKRANFKLPDDGKITLREWLEFGVKEVPNLYQLIISGKLKAVGKDAVMDESSQDRNNQRPSLFDFSRRPDVTIMSLASP